MTPRVTRTYTQKLRYSDLFNAALEGKTRQFCMFNELKAMAVGDKDLRLKTSEKRELMGLTYQRVVKTWRTKGGKFMANVHLAVGDGSQPKHFLKGGSDCMSLKSKEMAVQAACINAMRDNQYLGVWAKKVLGDLSHVVIHRPAMAGMKKNREKPFMLLHRNSQHIWMRFADVENECLREDLLVCKGQGCK